MATPPLCITDDEGDLEQAIGHGEELEAEGAGAVGAAKADDEKLGGHLREELRRVLQRQARPLGDDLLGLGLEAHPGRESRLLGLEVELEDLGEGRALRRADGLA
jgi:hypothetical protein